MPNASSSGETWPSAVPRGGPQLTVRRACEGAAPVGTAPSVACAGLEVHAAHVAAAAGIAGAAFSGLSATTASVVRNRPAIDAAFCSAERVTLAGSMMPASIRSTYSPVAALRPQPGSRSRTFSATTPPSRPALMAICLSGASTATRTMFAPVASSPVERRASSNAAFAGLDQRDATTGDDALLDGRLRVANGVLDAVLALLELDLGGRADLDDGNAAGELGQALLQLLAVVVGVRLLDLGADLVDPARDLLGVARTLDDRGLVLGDDDLAGAAEQVEAGGLELEADLLGDDLATGEDRDVLQHGLAAVTEARGLDGDRLEGAADLVDDQGRRGPRPRRPRR